MPTLALISEYLSVSIGCYLQLCRSNRRASLSRSDLEQRLHGFRFLFSNSRFFRCKVGFRGKVRNRLIKQC